MEPAPQKVLLLRFASVLTRLSSWFQLDREMIILSDLVRTDLCYRACPVAMVLNKPDVERSLDVGQHRTKPSLSICHLHRNGVHCGHSASTDLRFDFPKNDRPCDNGFTVLQYGRSVNG